MYQWDTKRTLNVDFDCSQVHFSNKFFGRSIDVDVVNGVAEIPDILLQSCNDLMAWAFVGTPENGYTKIAKVFKVVKRNKPSDYVFTPPEQTTLQELVERLDAIEESQDPDAIKNAVEDYLEQNPVESPVQSVNGKIGKVELTAEDVGAISQDDLQEATNEALARAKESGEFEGKDGITPRIGANGNWYLGETDTGVKAQGEDGKDGQDGYTPVKGVDYFDGKDGKDGKDGADGYTPQKGIDYFDGQPGADGKDGADGKNGTSVTVKSVSESAADGGSNVVTFSDGKTLTVRNGNKGSPGEKGDKGDTGSPGADGAKGDKGDKGEPGAKGDPGDNYVLTADDKEEIAQLAAGIVDTALLALIGTGEVTA